MQYVGSVDLQQDVGKEVSRLTNSHFHPHPTLTIAPPTSVDAAYPYHYTAEGAATSFLGGVES